MIRHDSEDGSYAEHTSFYPCGVCSSLREWAEDGRRASADIASGRVLPWRVAMLPLPRWAFSLLFAIAPFTWGRKARALVAKPTETQKGGQEP